MNISFNNAGKPAPWKFQKIKKAVSLTTTFVVGALAIYMPENSPLLLIIKLSESFLMSMLDTLLADAPPPPIV